MEAFLQELAARPAGPLVAQLPRLPGARENRWAHLLSGAPKAEASAGEARPEEEPPSELPREEPLAELPREDPPATEPEPEVTEP